MKTGYVVITLYVKNTKQIFGSGESISLSLH